jgi:hypothetical protein
MTHAVLVLATLTYAEAILHVCRRYVQVPLANVTGVIDAIERPGED